MNIPVLAPGARVLIRDAEWLVRKVDRTANGSQAVSVVGLSQIVKDREAIFLEEIDRIEPLNPADTDLVADTSSYYRDSLLFMESLLRQTPPTDEYLYIGHRGAMDIVPYQLDPAIQALKQPRQRILIADAVGLGKTIEAGILLSELIRRGKGKRILVLTVKSMLTQFQKELWSRFTIPLTRLDSVGLQRVRSRIPTNHNPFYYFDRAIISIDTLKQDAEYRTYLEKCYWDVIVIDEAHNVAARGTDSASLSMRYRLANLLKHRSDALIMLSATPHDGKPRAFASLMNMLNPTAIADPEDYGPEDIKGLFIRRFKKDIKDQVAKSFKERKIAVAKCQASPAEEKAFDVFTQMTFTRLDQRHTAGKLFKTTLEKALFSSPAACLQTIENRISHLQKEDGDNAVKDIQALQTLAEALQPVGPKNFSKYQKLLSVIRDPFHGFDWTGRDTKDRLVIFTERIDTLGFLAEHLPGDLGLKEDQIAILHGSLSDVDQQQIVEDFGREEAPVRLLLASDVASEGINLHFLCHRMIHFDIPWSFMCFQQRNGRIDRYGQEREPWIVYLMTESVSEKIKGDNRILELLITKDEQAVKNIGDPSALMGVYDMEEEERITAAAIEAGAGAADFENLLQKAPKDPLGLLMGNEIIPTGEGAPSAQKQMPSFFADDFSFFREALEYLKSFQPLQMVFDVPARTVNFALPLNLKHELEQRFRFLPPEIWPESGEFILSADRNQIMDEIRRTRKKEATWPKMHLLWDLHPLMRWLNDKLLAVFGRHQAPVLTLPGKLEAREVLFILSGIIPNRKSQPLIASWIGVRFLGGRFDAVVDFPAILVRTGLDGEKVPNQGKLFDKEALKKMLPEAIVKAGEWMHQRRKEFETMTDAKLNAQMAELDRLKQKRYRQLEFEFAKAAPTTRAQERKERDQREIDRIFAEYLSWIENSILTEDVPYIRVVAVLKGEA
ncbi:MAG: DEAD/DEAH box helicase [Syntrophobacterales bacterium]|nr:DEAD/DEAH box helicase [Syntrophobacterales bacterium]